MIRYYTKVKNYKDLKLICKTLKNKGHNKVYKDDVSGYVDINYLLEEWKENKIREIVADLEEHNNEFVAREIVGRFSGTRPGSYSNMATLNDEYFRETSSKTKYIVGGLLLIGFVLYKGCK